MSDWNLESSEYKEVMSEEGVKVIESRFPTGEVRVYKGGEVVKKYSKGLKSNREKALQFAKGMIEQKNRE